MKTYPIPMVPGPVRVPEAVLAAYRENFGSADLEPEFLETHRRAESALQRLMGTRNRVVIQSGEGMLALWSALKSCLAPGDRVLSVATGLFGEGIADMAEKVGAIVHRVRFPDTETLSDLDAVEREIRVFSPKMITVVHCETPSGTLNPLDGLGRIKKEAGVPLLYVDAVSSVGGAPLRCDEWNVDLCLGGSQKCLSSIPDTAFLSVSDGAWEVVERVGYAGYDALRPFRSAPAEHYFPYTPNWHSTAALLKGAEMILEEGLETVLLRHRGVAEICRRGLREMGIALFPADGAVPSPTVTAAWVPAHVPWPDFDARLRGKGLAVGGSYGARAGQVFRLGHMGSQADESLVRRALDILAESI